MPLHILLILVIGGIAGIALALHLLGLSRADPLTETTARQQWTRHFPDDTVLSVDVARSGRAARVQTDRGRGLLWQFGADTVARHVDRLRAEPRGTTLTLRLPDYTAPRVTLDLTPEELRDWTNWIETP